MTRDRTYYPLRYRLDGAERWLLGYSDDQDGLWIEADGVMPSFCSRPALAAYAEPRSVALSFDRDERLDLDAVIAWMGDAPGDAEDCELTINVWNLFTDVAATVEASLDDRDEETNHVYDKLFYGLNLPAVTPPGEHFEPAWGEDELILLCSVLELGLSLFRRHVWPV
jgi:hypothetical protein